MSKYDPFDQDPATKLEELGGKPAPYVDKTGTVDKPNPLRDVYEEFPLSMIAISKVTAFGAKKHAPRGWKTLEHDFAIDYHGSKLGRHLLDRELHGEINPADGDNLHSAAVAWNALARLEHILMKMEKEQDNANPHTRGAGQEKDFGPEPVRSGLKKTPFE